MTTDQRKQRLPGIIPICWRLDGKTSLRNVPRRNGCDWRQPPRGGATGSYTMRRTWRKAAATIKVVSNLGKRYPAYFITHTMPDYYDDIERRESWRRFLDVLRKEGAIAYAWITERHGGTGACNGLIHHHMVAVFPSVWWYTSKVRRWSHAYSASPNGLQIERVRRSAAAYLAPYMAKAIPLFGDTLLLTKNAGSPDLDVLPFRWWGAAGVPQMGCTYLLHAELDQARLRSPWFDKSSVWTSVALTSEWAAQSVFERVSQAHLRLTG